jgi:hypothetical protein
MSVSAAVLLLHSSKASDETDRAVINAEGFEYGRGRSRTPLTTLKIAVVSPMPRASVRTTVAENAGLRRKSRAE